MPQTTEDLIKLLDLEEIELGLYRGSQPRTHGQRTFGGQVLAQALVAAQRTVSEDRTCHSLNSYFLRGGSPDKPIIYDVENLRDGRSFSSRRVTARQNGQKLFAMNTSFQVSEEGLDHSDGMPPGVPDPEDCPNLLELLRERFSFNVALWDEWEAIDVRFAGDSGPSHSIEAKSHSSHMRVWVRTHTRIPDDPRLHQAVMAYLSDMTLLSVSTVPHRIAFDNPNMQVASIDHAMWFHRPVRVDEWVLYDQISPSASNARGFGTGRLVQDGKLVASCCQEGLIRVVEQD